MILSPPLRRGIAFIVITGLKNLVAGVGVEPSFLDLPGLRDPVRDASQSLRGLHKQFQLDVLAAIISR